MSQSTPEKLMNTNTNSKRTSIAWLYFTPTDDPRRHKCTQCGRLCSEKKKCTGNLVRHLRLRHPKIYAAHHPDGVKKRDSQAINEDEITNSVANILVEGNKDSEDPMHTAVDHTEEIHHEEAPKSPAQQNQQDVAYYLVEQIDVNRAKEIDNQVLKVIVKEFYHFELVENQEFITFVQMLNSNYALPNCKSLSTELLLSTYHSAAEHLKSILKEIQYVALTIDKWTSTDDENVISITAYYLNKDLTLHNNLLDCISFPKDSTANIAIFLQEIVDNWGVSDKIVAVVADNDPTIVNAIEKCQWSHISCFAHTLNTTILTCLEEIDDVLNKVRSIVDYFKRNPSAMAELETYQNEMNIGNIKLKKDTPNRWNSIFDMITSFLKNKDILKSEYIKDMPSELSGNDWFILENAVKLLIVFYTITVEICSENIVPLSKVPFMMRFVQKHVTNIIGNATLPSKIKVIGEKLKEKLFQQSKIIETSDIVCQSVLLDPRFKKRGFLETSFDAAYSSLLENVISLKNKRMQETWAAQPGMTEDTKEEYFIDVWSEFRETVKPPMKDFTLDATAEIDAFLSESYISMKDDPLNYWAKEINQNKSPILFELVKSRLCVPASSVPCKNIFFKTENALIEKRSFLPSKYLKEVLFLHYNL